MAGVGSGTELGLEGAVLHLLDPGHFLKDDLALLNEFTHGQSIV